MNENVNIPIYVKVREERQEGVLLAKVGTRLRIVQVEDEDRLRLLSADQIKPRISRQTTTVEDEKDEEAFLHQTISLEASSPIVEQNDLAQSLQVGDHWSYEFDMSTLFCQLKAQTLMENTYYIDGSRKQGTIHSAIITRIGNQIYCERRRLHTNNIHQSAEVAALLMAIKNISSRLLSQDPVHAFYINTDSTTTYLNYLKMVEEVAIREQKSSKYWQEIMQYKDIFNKIKILQMNPFTTMGNILVDCLAREGALALLTMLEEPDSPKISRQPTSLEKDIDRK